MVIVLVHLVVLAALGRADRILRHSSENDMHQFDIERAHQEAEQRAVHRRAIAAIFLVYLSKELPHRFANSRLEDWFTGSDSAHDDSCSDASEVV